VWRDGRPSLGLVLALVLATVLALPLAGVLASGVYDDGLLKRTEAELLAQSAALAADAGRTIAETVPPDVPLGAPVLPGPVIAPALGPQRPRRPDAVEPVAAADPAFRAVGARLATDLAATQAVTLAGFRLLDPFGTVIAGWGEVGQSLAGVEEVAAALDGRTAAALRRRVSKHRYPALGSLSRGRPARVFVAVPVVVRGRVAGVVYASRTPVDLLGSLYGQRTALELAAAAVVLAALMAGLVLHRAISLPVRELIGLSVAIGSRDAAAVASHRHHGTVEFAALAASLRGMARRLTERGDAVAGFAAHVSHELKSPLSAIRGSAELLRDDDLADPMAPDERRRFLDHLLADTERLGALLDRLREMSRAEAEPTAGRAALRPALAAVAARFPGLVLQAEGEGEADMRISADNLLALLTHLADNAVRHGARRLDVSARPEGAVLRIEVRDDGAGITPGNRARVFDSFFTTRREDGGTGMGLAIVRALVGAHGGSVALIDTERGAGFALLVPLSEVAAPARPRSGRRRRALAATALVVLAGLLLRLWGPGVGLPFAVTKVGGSVLWGAMVYGIAAVSRPAARPGRLAAGAFAFAVLVELFRLVHAPWLDAFRLTLAGALLLGRVFSPWNVLFYALGIAMARRWDHPW
jgi:signal transduction histidine kinase